MDKRKDILDKQPSFRGKRSKKSEITYCTLKLFKNHILNTEEKGRKRKKEEDVAGEEANLKTSKAANPETLCGLWI